MNLKLQGSDPGCWTMMLRLEGSSDQTSCRGSFTQAIPIIYCHYWWHSAQRSNHFLPPSHSTFFPVDIEAHFYRWRLKPQQCATKLCRLKRWQLLRCSRGQMIHIDGSAVKVSKSNWRDKETCRHDEGFFYDAQFSLTMFSNNNLCIFRRNFLFLFSKGLDLSSREGQRPAKANPNSQRKFSAFQNPNSKAESVLCCFIRNYNFYLNEKA